MLWKIDGKVSGFWNKIYKVETTSYITRRMNNKMNKFVNDFLDSMPMFFGIVFGILGIFWFLDLITLEASLRGDNFIWELISSALLIGLSFGLLKIFFDKQ